MLFKTIKIPFFTANSRISTKEQNFQDYWEKEIYIMEKMAVVAVGVELMVVGVGGV